MRQILAIGFLDGELRVIIGALELYPGVRCGGLHQILSTNLGMATLLSSSSPQPHPHPQLNQHGLRTFHPEQRKQHLLLGIGLCFVKESAVVCVFICLVFRKGLLGSQFSIL